MNLVKKQDHSGVQMLTVHVGARTVSDEISQSVAIKMASDTLCGFHVDQHPIVRIGEPNDVARLHISCAYAAAIRLFAGNLMMQANHHECDCQCHADFSMSRQCSP